MATLTRMHRTTTVVLEMLLDADQPVYGYQISQISGIRAGTLYPILARLAGLGWVKTRHEKINPSERGRPPRVYYQLTARGRLEAQAALARSKHKS